MTSFQLHLQSSRFSDRDYLTGIGLRIGRRVFHLPKVGDGDEDAREVAGDVDELVGGAVGSQKARFCIAGGDRARRIGFLHVVDVSSAIDAEDVVSFGNEAEGELLFVLGERRPTQHGLVIGVQERQGSSVGQMTVAGGGDAAADAMQLAERNLDVFST